MATITMQPMIANKAILNSEALASTKEISFSSTPETRQKINLESLPSLIPTEGSEKPTLKSPLNDEFMPEQLMNALSDLDVDKTENPSVFLNISPTKFANQLYSIFEDAEQKSVEETKASKPREFIGIMGSNIIVEISKLIRKVASEIKISDRQISAAFNILSGKMVEAAAASTIKEGKKMMEGALISFGVSLGVSSAGAAFQAKSLHTQNKSINTNLKPGTNNINTGNKLNAQASDLKSTNSSSVLQSKDGNMIELTGQATAGQKALVARNAQNAADSTKAYGQNQLNEYNNVATKENVKRGIAEQGSRLSESTGNMAASSSQVDAKAESANAMIEQETSSAARKVSENADKTISESTELLKKMNEALKDIRDSKIRTFQAAIRG